MGFGNERDRCRIYYYGEGVLFVISIHHLDLNPLLVRFLAALLIPCGLG